MLPHFPKQGINFSVVCKTATLPPRWNIIQFPTQTAVPRGHRDAFSFILRLAPQRPFEVLDKPKLPQLIPNRGLHGQKWGKDLPKRRSPSWVSPPWGSFAHSMSKGWKKVENRRLSPFSSPIPGTTHTWVNAADATGMLVV